MNAYFPLTLTLCGLVAPWVVMAPAIAHPASEIEAIAAAITVRIDGINPGSGVIVGHQGDRYWVLTARHVVGTEDEYWLVTSDGRNHAIDYNRVRLFADVDLAVLEFRSDRPYPVATLASYPQDSQFPYVFVSGWSGSPLQNQPLEHQFVAGLLLRRTYALVQSQDPLARGYDLFYTNITDQGMSGGPILDTEGHVIGIHGRSEGEEVYDAHQGTYHRLLLGFSGGIPIQTFLRMAHQMGLPERWQVTGDRPTPLTPAAHQSIQVLLAPQPLDDPQDPIAWTNRGNQLYRLERFSEALDAFDRALQLQPTLHQAWYGQGQVLTTQQRYPEALQALNQALQIQPSFAAALRDRALVYALQESYEAAIADLDRVIQLAPEDYVAWYLRGNLFSRRMDWQDAALGSYDRALHLAPTFALAWVERGRTLHTLGRDEDALQSLQRGAELNPDLALAWFWQGQVLLALGQAEQGLAAVDRAIALAPDDTESWLLRARLLMAMGRTAEAQEVLEQVGDRDPNHPAVADLWHQLSP